MTTRLRPLIATALAMAALGTVAFAAENKCEPIAKQQDAEIAKDKDNVLKIVEKYVSQNPDCVCYLIKSAIAAVNADEDMQKAIVLTALHAAPAQAAQIRSCIPGADAWVSAEMGGGKQPVGKVPVTKEGPEGPVVTKGEWDISPPTWGTGAVYLAAPGGGGGAGNPSNPPTITVTVSTPPKVVKLPPRNPVTLTQ